MADPRVLRAMSTPLLGQFDPEFTAIMGEVVELSRFAFQTANARAFPVPGTGRADNTTVSPGPTTRLSRQLSSTVRVGIEAEACL